MIRHVLMTCTGNTCRSPLAEALMRSELARHGADGTAVSSAGTGAWDGAPASEGALLVGLEHDVDLSSHRARLLNRDLVSEADIIFTMSRHQRARVEELGGAGKVHVLGEYAGSSGPAAEVADPWGADLAVYRATFSQLEGFVRIAAQRLVGQPGEQDQRD